MDSPHDYRGPRPEPDQHASRLSFGAVIGVLLAFIFAATGTLDRVADVSADALRSQQTPATVAQGLNDTETADADIGSATLSTADVAALANPAVVTIETSFARTDMNGIAGRDDRGRFPEQTGAGSGFIFSIDGYVITNAHVVANGASFEVRYFDGTTVAATLVGADAYADVAVLKIDVSVGEDVPGIATIGSSGDVVAGQPVVAIGSPFGNLTNTVSDGIVGAIDRSLDTGSGGYLLTDLIQHDAEIYPGNSGGPLLNMNGEVIGINTAALVSNGTGGGSIGFAVSIDSVLPLIEDIIASGQAERPYLGVQAETLRNGAQGIVSVQTGGPVDGVLEPGDIVIAIDANEIGFESPFLNMLFTYAAGDTLTLTIERDGDIMQLDVTLGERPGELAG